MQEATTVTVCREVDAGVRTRFGAYLRETASSLFAHRYSIGYMIRNNLQFRYRRSYLGFLWNLITPFVTMIIIAVVFSLVFKSSLRHFAIYVFSGMVPWGFISSSLSNGSTSLIGGERYLKKLAIPKLIFPIVAVGTEIVNFVISLLCLIVIACVAAGCPGIVPLILLVPAIAVTIVFTLALVILFSVANVYFRDIPYVLNLLLTALFYLIPIIYPLELIPERYLPYYKLNPFLPFVMIYRKLLYEGAVPAPALWGTCILLTGIALLTALLLVHRKDHDIIFRL